MIARCRRLLLLARANVPVALKVFRSERLILIYFLVVEIRRQLVLVVVFTVILQHPKAMCSQRAPIIVNGVTSQPLLGKPTFFAPSMPGKQPRLKNR
jgi:hypothetical protein